MTSLLAAKGLNAEANLFRKSSAPEWMKKTVDVGSSVVGGYAVSVDPLSAGIQSSVRGYENTKANIEHGMSVPGAGAVAVGYEIPGAGPVMKAAEAYDGIGLQGVDTGRDLSNFERGMRAGEAIGDVAGGVADGVSTGVKAFRGAGTAAREVSAESKAAAEAIEHVPNAPRRLTPQNLRDYLANVKEKSRAELIQDMESVGVKLKGKSSDSNFMEFVDKHGNVRAKIHPPDKVTTYDHLHIYDRSRMPLNTNLKPVSPRDPAAHIEIRGAE